MYILHHAVTVREKEYMGQSDRQFGTRLNEHQKAVSTLNQLWQSMFVISWIIEKLDGKLAITNDVFIANWRADGAST